jgi:hypothetical protein
MDKEMIETIFNEVAIDLDTQKDFMGMAENLQSTHDIVEALHPGRVEMKDYGNLLRAITHIVIMLMILRDVEVSKGNGWKLFTLYDIRTKIKH